MLSLRRLRGPSGSGDEMVTPKSREVLGQCLLGSVLQSSHDVLTQTGVEGLGSSSLMSDGER